MATDPEKFPTVDPTKTTDRIFILSGQSNMSGRGGVTGHGPHKKWDAIVPPECRPDPQILRFTAHLHWEQAHEPLHRDIDSKKTCGVGPGMAFARAVRAQDPECTGYVGLVPCAVGGTAIREWGRGSHLYEIMVRRARESVRRGGRIEGLIWYQGESDSYTREDAEGKMEELVKNVRADLGLPLLPIVQVAIVSGGDGAYVEMVRESQLGMCAENVVCVDAKGLNLKEDNLHLTTEAQVKLGGMLADAYLKNFTSYSAPGCT
ncbi:LOW QUALITY PROTEIN: hypothetical protein Sjap_017366 [Stephania japonica]|uniref:Sialate O-acetylesterase domain-containing protein n=1 Tax=Stephania japonica TaxID=461633 RepID=A0AAP0I646_9MAGN